MSRFNAKIAENQSANADIEPSLSINECGPVTMATVIANVTDCRSFWREIVVPDYNDFNAAIDNIRRAFHCAISLFHLCDRVYHAHKPYIGANFVYRDRKMAVSGLHRRKTFANALGDLHPDFDLIRGSANSAKHLVLTKSGPHPGSPSHAANTRVQTTGFGEGAMAWDLTAVPRASCSKAQAARIKSLPILPTDIRMWQRLSSNTTGN